MEKETEKEFVRIRTEFQSHKTEIDKKHDDFMIEIRNIVKPPFSVKELIMYFIAFLAVYAAAIFYISRVENNGDNTRKELDKQNIENKEFRKETAEKLDKILVIVNDTKTTVAVLEGKKVDKVNTQPTLKEQVEKNKQIVREWAVNQ